MPASLLFCFLFSLLLCFSCFSCFSAFLLFLLLCFSISLLFCCFAFLLLCFSCFSLFCFSALLCLLLFQRLCLSCLSVPVPFYFYLSMPSCVFASLLLPTPLLLCFLSLLSLCFLCFFPFVLSCSACFVSMRCLHQMYLLFRLLLHVMIPWHLGAMYFLCGMWQLCVNFCFPCLSLPCLP